MTIIRLFINCCYCLVFFLVFSACSRDLQVSQSRISTSKQLRLSAQEKALADSFLLNGLDHEALYSILADLKPMSSMGSAFTFGIGKDSTDYDGQYQVVSLEKDSLQKVVQSIESWNKITQQLSFGNLRFVLVPFRRVWDGQRNFQLLVCRTDLIDQKLREHATFFGQWGFVPGTDVATLITAIEFEQKNDRYRAYGYLFGYPAHAVDFFVEASRSEEKNQEFVKRDFFQIPVYAGDKGYFTYAVPKGYQASKVDSSIYHQAKTVLENYRSLRKKYEKKSQGFRANRLVLDYWRRRSR